LIDPSQKEVETMEVPQIKRFYGKMECLPIWPTYIGEKGRTLGKNMGLKPGAIGNTHGEHIGNLMETHWEIERNIEGTCWEQRKNEKNPAPPKN